MEAYWFELEQTVDGGVVHRREGVCPLAWRRSQAQLRAYWECVHEMDARQAGKQREAES